jgi:deoxyribonuclease-4
MRIGAHVDSARPLDEAAERRADTVQFFLADPQGWKSPEPRADAEQLRVAPVDVYIHAPYVINVATLNNRIRIPSRKLLAAHAAAAAHVGAKGLIVHGGHVTASGDLPTGFANWRKAFEYAQESGGFPTRVLIENTAGGDNAVCRRFDALARLWDAVGEFDVGFCLDTCHAHAGGEDLVDIVDRVKAITGRVDLIHANDSRDPAGSGRDRHESIGKGQIGVDPIAAVISEAGVPAICETPGRVDRHREDLEALRSHVKG